MNLDVSIEIILNAFKCLKNVTLIIEPILFISFNILREFDMLSLRKRRWTLLPKGKDVQIQLNIHEKISPLPAIILLRLENTSKKQDCKVIALSLILLVQTFDKILIEKSCFIVVIDAQFDYFQIYLVWFGGLYRYGTSIFTCNQPVSISSTFTALAFFALIVHRILFNLLQ